jgi:cysteine synthase A
MPLPCQVASCALELIGNTPLVRLRRIVGAGAGEVLGKLETANPGASVKDRICLAMIEAAEADGRLGPGATIVEPTSGNTGIGLAMVAAARGYRLILTMPEAMSEERRGLLRAYGAEVVSVKDSNGMQASIEKAHEIAEAIPGAFMPSQFDNPANPEAHRRTTAAELLHQCPRIDAFVAGVGTGGTITGVGRALREHSPATLVVAVEPAASAVLAGSGAGAHAIAGIGPGFVPANLDRSVIDRVVTVEDSVAVETTRRLAAEEGLLVGVSAGAAVAAAIDVARELGPGTATVCMLCDSGERYLTTGLFSGGQGL